MRFLKSLYVQVLIGVALGIAVGFYDPAISQQLKPLGDGFIKLIRLVIAPVIFCTVAGGIARMSDLKTFGRIGLKAMLYFEFVSSFALLLGLVVGEVLKPGAGFHIDPHTLDPKLTATWVHQAQAQGWVEHLMGIIPDSFVGAFTGGDVLQVLLLAILTGFGCTRLGDFGHKVAEGLEGTAQVFFGIVRVIVRLAPIGAFGAMAFTVGKYGPDALVRLGSLVGVFYLTGALFVLIVLGIVARITGFSILKFLIYIGEELLIVLGASSSEAALPQLMQKLERLGASKAVVGLVVPTGYSFNLDGTNIYMTLATLFLAQATDTHLTLVQEATILGVAMLTSKGASGVTGAGFITLAATLAVVPDIPIASIAILVGVDRFMSECRALTNVIGNGVGTLAVARWDGALDRAKLKAELG
jgi:aerobic C4-dicarboxylate transport protein